MLKIKIVPAFIVLACSFSVAQGSAPQASVPTAQLATARYSVTPMLDELQTFSQNAVAHISRIRIDKWKGDAKSQAQTNAESLQRNMNGALPTLIQQVRSNPASIAATLKLYRNLNALYDVMMSFSDLASAYGSKDDYYVISNDAAMLENIRRNYADQLEKMAAAQDAQVVQLMSQATTPKATEATSSGAKKVIVDDNAPAKKTTSSSKKKPTAKTAAKPE